MPSYDIGDYAAMAADPIRIDAYRRALRQHVMPGCRVLDLGAGTGVFGFLALQMGAGKVIFVEPQPVAQHISVVAAMNGAMDRVEVHQARSDEIALQERVDVIVSDLRGASPVVPGLLQTVIDARERFLRPGGVLLPQRDRLVADLVTTDWSFRRHVAVWDECAPGWDQSLYRNLAVRTAARVKFNVADLLGQPRAFGAIDYRIATSPHVSGEPAWTPDRDIEAFGIALWFEADLTDDVSFGSGPGGAEVYRQLYLPWQNALSLGAGDRVSVRLLFAASDIPTIRWRTWLRRKGGAEQPVWV